jgi:transposase-like protein
MVRHGFEYHGEGTPSELQYSDRKLRAQLSRELGIKPKTVAKWRKRATVETRRPGPRSPD